MSQPNLAILYCDRCGQILMPSQVEQAVVTDKVTVCPTCLADMSDEQRQQLKPSREAPSSRRGSSEGGRLRASQKRPAVKLQGSTSAGSAAAGSNKYLPLAVAAAGCLAGVAIVVVLTRGGKPRRSSPSPAASETPVTRAVPVTNAGTNQNPSATTPSTAVKAVAPGVDPEEEFELSLGFARAMTGSGKYDRALESLNRIEKTFAGTAWHRDGGGMRIAGALAEVRKAMGYTEKDLNSSPLAVTRGLVAWWTLDTVKGGQAEDSSGAGLHGKVVGTPRRTVGRNGGAFDFDGKSDGIDCPVPDNLTMSELSIAMWVNVPKTGWKAWHEFWCADLGSSIAVGELSGDNGWSKDGNVSLYNLKGKAANFGALATKDHSIHGTGWRHIVWTFSKSGKETKIYVDGKVTARISNAPTSSIKAFQIGFAKRRPGHNIRASIDDVRLYSRALSAAEIKSIMSGGASASAPQDGLVGWWRLDESRGPRANDSSGQNAHGKLISAHLWQPSEGRIDGAKRFNGKCWIEVPTTGISTQRGTVAAWARPRRAGHKGYVFSHQGTTKNDRIYLLQNGGQFRAGIGDQISTAGKPEKIDAWSHLALTWSGGQYRFYVDGREAASGSYKSLTTLKDICYIGCHSEDKEGWLGLVDDVRVYDRALSAAEISSLRTSAR